MIYLSSSLFIFSRPSRCSNLSAISPPVFLIIHLSVSPPPSPFPHTSFFFLRIRPPPRSPLFPYPTLSRSRGPARVAQTPYRETGASRELRQKAAEERRATRQFDPSPHPRPTNRDRRKIIQFKGGK